MTSVRSLVGVVLLSTALTVAGCEPAFHGADEPASATTQRAATAIEYGLIAALIAVVIIGELTALGTALEDTFDSVASEMDAANDAAQDRVPPTCLEACLATLETDLAQCTTTHCADVAIASHSACVQACRGRGAPRAKWPMIALQLNDDPALTIPREDAFGTPARFVVPEAIRVAYGAPGTSEATLSWQTPRGAQARCTYAADRNRYVLASCSDGSATGDVFEARQVRLSVTPGDRRFAVTAAALDLARAR